MPVGADADVALLPVCYLDRWSVAPGESLSVHASGQGGAVLSLVRLRGLVGAVVPTGYIEEPASKAATVELEPRNVPMGSYAITERGPAVDASSRWQWTLHLMPTLTDRGEVMRWGSDGPVLYLRDGVLVARWNETTLIVPVDAGAWSEVILAHTGTGRLELSVKPLGGGAWYRHARHQAAKVTPRSIAGALTLARGFNGKLAGPRLEADDQSIASWDFSQAITTQSVPGRGQQGSELRLVNAPRRGVTGVLWDGSAHDWRTQPSHYDSIHFHDDDLSDCEWPVTATLQIPSSSPSGMYAVRIDADGQTFHAPFVVRARETPAVVFLASTFTWLAYANSLWASPSGAALARAYPREAALCRRYGCSMYARHRDGSGIGLVSTRRPVLTGVSGLFGEAHGGQVTANDDLRVLQWLDGTGMSFSVITDHDLHTMGPQVLAGARVVVTGGHPEYHSRESLDALASFTATGGRLLYLGGNGFYTRVSTLPDTPHVLEVRRAEGGVRMWAEPAGEYHHQSDGALGGLWRRLGRPPNQLVGVGFSAQGSEMETRAYVRTPAAGDARVAFLFEGVCEGEIGAAGPLGAAAGYELDRADVALGTPPHALVVARSLPFGPLTAPVNEERLTHEVLDAHDPLRADMTFFEGPAGGAVFAAGSLLFPGALTETDGAGRIVLNALRRMADPEPFELPPLRPD